MRTKSNFPRQLSSLRQHWRSTALTGMDCSFWPTLKLFMPKSMCVTVAWTCFSAHFFFKHRKFKHWRFDHCKFKHWRFKHRRFKIEGLNVEDLDIEDLNIEDLIWRNTNANMCCPFFSMPETVMVWNCDGFNYLV